jgi:hypothetical protein
MAARQSPKLYDEGSNPSRPAVNTEDVLVFVVLGAIMWVVGWLISELLLPAGFRIDWWQYRYFWTHVGWEPFYATMPPFG